MSDRNLRLPEVRDLTGLSKSEIYRRIKAGAFPSQRRISSRVAIWPESAVKAWVQASRLPGDAQALLA